MYEWITVSAEETMMQCDIIARVGMENGECDYGVVLTADCDISKCKFGKNIATLPMLKFVDYFYEYYVAGKVKERIESEVSSMHAEAVKWHSKKDGRRSALTVHGFREWLLEKEHDEVCSSLGVPEKNLESFLRRLGKCREFLSDYKAVGFERKYAKIVSLINGNSEKEIHKKWVESFCKSQFPQDIFLVYSMPMQEKMEPYVIMLREIVNIPVDEVVFRKVDGIGEGKWFRVGRFKPEFKYAITQCFASLYSRIGLPDEYAKSDGNVGYLIDTLMDREV